MGRQVRDIFLLIEARRFEFTATEQVIADYLLSKRPIHSIDELAKTIAVSSASITRFSKKLGLSNFKELIFLYNLSLGPGEDAGMSISSGVTASYHALATKSESFYRESAVRRFSQSIHEHRLILFWGLGFNSFVGEDFRFKFTRLGKIVTTYSDQRSINLAATETNADDLVMISSLSGNDKSLLNAARIAAKKGTKILLVTVNEDSPIVEFAYETLFAASLDEEERFGSISPQVPMLMQLDMVYGDYLRTYHKTAAAWMKAETILNED